jgi:N-acetyl-alpha-D-muramate 1-phosphate uridylyltransferase
MVLAAGFGTRMRPLTDSMPKPLVQVAGRPLIDHVLDRLAEAGVQKAVVNVHYLADMLEAHLAEREQPEIQISDERGELLDTGGGIVRALPLLGNEPFFLSNSDSVWIEGVQPLLGRLADTWDEVRMDGLLAIAPTVSSVGYVGAGDFVAGPDGRLSRRGELQLAPFVYTGIGILSPALFTGAPDGRFSLNVLFDGAIEAGRLFGVRLDGLWMHVGTPQSVAAAEQAILAGST